MRRRRAVLVPVAVLLALGGGLAGCSGAVEPGASTGAVTSAAPTRVAHGAPPSAAASAAGSLRKVLVIAEENETYGAVLGSGSAPYLDSVARDFGTATAMDAGYPVACPSLAAYLLMTSGDRYGVCDDDDPSAHPIRADNIFEQVAVSGREWRNYAESMPAPCTRSGSGTYLVRHAPAAYYLSEAARCPQWMVPLGTLAAGALHDDITAGTLPAYGFVTPNACDDMHGGAGCSESDLVRSGDAWLRAWMAQVMAGPDYRSGRLVVVITWDEGSSTSNHIPLLVVSPTTVHRTVTRPISQCDVLRTIEQLLRLAPLGCAASASSLAPDLGLTGSTG